MEGIPKFGKYFKIIGESNIVWGKIKGIVKNRLVI